MAASDHLSPHQFRWVHHGEYTAAQEAGSFKSNINASIGEPDHRYMAGDSMLLRFQGGEHWKPKEDNPSYSRATRPPAFHEAEVVQANPMVPKHLPGHRPTKDAQGNWVMAPGVKRR